MMVQRMLFVLFAKERERKGKDTWNRTFPVCFVFSNIEYFQSRVTDLGTRKVVFMNSSCTPLFDVIFPHVASAGHGAQKMHTIIQDHYKYWIDWSDFLDPHKKGDQRDPSRRQWRVLNPDNSGIITPQASLWWFLSAENCEQLPQNKPWLTKWTVVEVDKVSLRQVLAHFSN